MSKCIEALFSMITSHTGIPQSSKVHVGCCNMNNSIVNTTSSERTLVQHMVFKRRILSKQSLWNITWPEPCLCRRKVARWQFLLHYKALIRKDFFFLQQHFDNNLYFICFYIVHYLACLFYAISLLFDLIIDITDFFPIVL